MGLRGKDRHEDDSRGTGRTTKQMMSAPLGAVFVWCNNDTHYPMFLANRLGRTDLKVVGSSWLNREAYKGIDPARIVIDHAKAFA